jgi:NitT/TauT family transport system permease protein
VTTGVERATAVLAGAAAGPRTARGGKLLVIAALLALWEAGVRASGVSELLVPAPSRVAVVFWDNLVDGRLLRYVWQTLKVLLAGMAIGSAIALVFTTLASFTRPGRALLEALAAMLNPLPSIALMPLALIWLGIGFESLLFVIVNAVIWPIALNMYMGFETVPLTLKRVGRNLGLEGWRLVKDIYVPAALPYIYTGMKLAWSFGWRTVIAAELVFGTSGQGGGLGWMINVERYNLNTAAVFVGLVAIILIGLAAEAGFQFIEKRTIRKWGMTS